VVNGMGAGSTTDGRHGMMILVLGIALPKVKDWFGSAALQEVWSMISPLTTRQVPAEFVGDKAKGPAPPANENN
jgi:hypothetical protein